MTLNGHIEISQSVRDFKMPTQKLYKRVNGTLHYHEAWSTEIATYEHWGIVGERGECKVHPLCADTERENAVFAILRPSIRFGFTPIEPDECTMLLIEYTVDEMGRPYCLGKRHELEDRLNETLGWTGLGHCLGGSSGSGTMEVICAVVDFEIAKRVIQDDIAQTKFSDYTRIYS